MKLAELVAEQPTRYGYPASEVPTVVGKMGRAFAEGTFNHDGLAIARTCRALGLKHTRSAMLAFFRAST